MRWYESSAILPNPRTVISIKKISPYILLYIVPVIVSLLYRERAPCAFLVLCRVAVFCFVVAILLNTTYKKNTSTRFHYTASRLHFYTIPNNPLPVLCAVRYWWHYKTYKIMAA